MSLIRRLRGKGGVTYTCKDIITSILLTGLLTASVSDHFDGKKFHNPEGAISKGFFQVLKWKFTSDEKDWPTTVVNTHTPRLPAGEVSSDEAHVTFVNHATTLVQLAGWNVITDPIFSERASPFSWAGPKRVRPPGIAFDQLPPIHAVVVSHNHYDHMDLRSLRDLHAKHHPVFLVPLGNGKLLRDEGIDNVLELDWWQSHAIAQGREVTLVPAQHWSARGLFDRNEVLWGGYVLSSGAMKVYFAGDTGYGPHFKTIREKIGKIAISLLPIGAYEPRWFMKDQHINPTEAVLAHQDLGSELSLGIHYETFHLSDEGLEDPPTDLRTALASAGIPEVRFRAFSPGETVVFRLEK